MKSRINKIICLSLLAVATAGAFALSSYTLAKYVQKKEITQQTGYQGPITEYSIFLDVIHRRADSFSWADANAIFYMYCYDSSDANINTWVSPVTHITPTISGNATNMYVFRFDSTKYNSYNLVRFNPNGATVPGWGWDNGSTWNSTQGIPFDSYTYNYYKINGVETPNGDDYGHTTSNANWGKISYSDGNWSIVYP